MPELPDAEIFRRYFAATALHREIAQVVECQTDLLREVSRGRLCRELAGRRFEDSVRHGKYLFARLDSGLWLVLHFGMTGFLRYFKDAEKSPRHVRLLLRFLNGYHLAYDCQRKLGRIFGAADPDRFVAEHGLGPDPLQENYEFKDFREAMAHKRGSVKSALMDQSLLAGIGNVYSDEILFHVGLHPKTPVKKMTEKELAYLFDALKTVLRQAIDCRVGKGGWPEGWLVPRRPVREGKAECPLCGGEIVPIKVSGRRGFFCPGHQAVP